ncbi:zinc-binding dehydrogenase [Rudanella paleaurantiibacter]|uniref:Zinc-binding dehydrogenase n=1 Tax=Rudanella paleaurantiibacter TaxID=2614655 RepID=A0A7J5TXB6_9BACT|nr:zinc-binding dehydrogenase [Rudanella paleaurantiibacter]KAB7729289.1 zinc-binding dehydrogenase [Rudanella paleaurantiibacter]
MKAIRLTEVHQPAVLTDLPTPEAGPGQVLIKLKAAALNHRDVFVQQGLYPGMKLPVTPGSDGAGVVEAVGDGVDAQLVGQAVVINPGLNWGNDPRFYSRDFRILGMPDDGTFAEYIAVPAQYVYPKPTHLSFTEAAALPLAALTAWRALMTRAALQPGERVLVTGIGGGAALYALQLAVAAGAEVWVTSGSDEKLARAGVLGAKGGVNYHDANWHKNLMEATGGGKTGYFDVTIDSASGPDFAKLLDTATPGGRIAVFGGTTGNITNVPPSKLFFKQLNIFGSTMGSDAEFAAMLAFVNQHGLQPTVDEVFALADAEQALRKMESGKQFGKIILAAE